MKVPTLACAIYMRKSSEERLEQGFNSLDAQREACEAFTLSQKALGWVARPEPYDDGGFSGGNADRPALQRLLADIAAKRVKVVVIYKVDRLTGSLADFANVVELFDAHGVSFVSVTQQFNTTSSTGRLTLNEVQGRLAANRQGHRARANVAHPCLLAGLVFDEQGGRLTPSHAQKESLRYRYYVGSRLPESETGGPKTLRVPAQGLEDAVVGAIVGFLNDESRVLHCIGTVDGIATQDGLRRARSLAQELKANSVRLSECIERITVAADKIAIRVKSNVLAQSEIADAEDDAQVIEVPMRLKRCGQAIRLIVHAPTATLSRSPDVKLIALLARVHDWFARLSSGNDDYVSTIAAEDGFSPSYVTRVIYRVFLAPDIV